MTNSGKQTKREHQNARKQAINKLRKKMAQEGYEFRKCVKNTVTFVHVESFKKKRLNLEIT